MAIKDPFIFQFKDQEFLLLPERAILWLNRNTLILGDLHLGKVSHFRKNGIAISESAQFKNLDKLQSLIDNYEIEEVLFLGDLFHSSTNSEWIGFKNFISLNFKIRFELILGNHDIIEQSKYEEIGVKCFETKKIKPFLFCHEPRNSEELYVLSGHIHPGVKMKGKGRQSIMLPCFYFGEKQGILPAFGSLTGLAEIKVKKTDQVYLIVEDKVVVA